MVNKCPDCLVAVSSCFYFTNQFGDQVTSMQLTDYAIAIGNRLCSVVGQVSTLQTAVSALNDRVTILEAAPAPVFVLPKFIPTTVLPPLETDIATILQALEQQFGYLRSATGTPDQLYQSLTRQPNALNTAVALGPIGGSMGAITGWFNNPMNIAATINNMWLTIGDLRAAVGNIKLNYSPKGCDGITIELQLKFIVHTLKLFFTGTIPAGFQSCAQEGTMFTITDTSGGLVNMYVNVITGMNNPDGVSLNLANTPLNLLNNLTIVGTPCFYNKVTNATCQSALQETFYNTVTCPKLLLDPLFTSFTYNVVTLLGTITYTVQVWNAVGSILISSTSNTEKGPGILSGSIGGLSEATTYKVRLVLTIGAVSTECAFQSVTTFAMPEIPVI